MVILLLKDDAINESIKHSKARVEIFSKKNDISGYTPTYNYYENGKLIQNSFKIH